MQWDAGALVVAGLLVRPACLLGCAAVSYTALSYTALHASEHLTLTTTARPLALASALGLLLIACSRRHADAPPPRPAISDKPRLLSAPRPLITALTRTEPS